MVHILFKETLASWISFWSFLLILEAEWARNLSFSMTWPLYDSKPRLVFLISASLSISKNVVGFSSRPSLVVDTLEYLMAYCQPALRPALIQIRKEFLLIFLGGVIMVPFRVCPWNC